MIGFTQENEARLLELLGEELEIFEEIRKITIGQSDLLAEDDVEEFNLSLDRRQERIDKINGLHQEAGALMQSYISFSESPGKGKSSAVEAVRGKLRAVISECVELNEKNLAASKEKAEDYIKKIGKLSLSRKSIGAYAQSLPNNSEYFDKKT